MIYTTNGEARPARCDRCDEELRAKVYDSQIGGTYETKASYVVPQFGSVIQRWCPACGTLYLP